MRKKIKAAFLTLFTTKWFVKTSWQYVTTKSFKSKIDFFKGLPTAWFRFSKLTYKDYLISL